MAEKSMKWKSRRWLAALIGITLVVADKIYCVEKGLDIEWFRIFTDRVVLLTLFGAGLLTATNLMNQWWQNRNGNSEKKE